MFRVKICGVTSVEDAICAVEAGADAIGLNFYEKSSRCVSGQRAREISVTTHFATARLKRFKTACIGVFVNHSTEGIRQLCKDGFLTGAQLHGDESPADVATVLNGCSSLPRALWTVVRARPFNDHGVSAIADDLRACRQAGGAPHAVLIDAMTPGRYGGTGETVSWLGLADHERWLNVPLILAGGLTPDNVAEAIRIVRPAAVDVASGVESAPGRKDQAKVRDFVANALGAFEALGP
jgi:phosphoribosylanthranilate isomerase